MTRKLRRQKEPEKLEDILKEIPPEFIEVLHSHCTDEYVTGLHNGSIECHMPLKLYTKMTRELYERHLLEFGHLTQEDENLVCGSGYWLSPLGKAVLKAKGLSYWSY